MEILFSLVTLAVAVSGIYRISKEKRLLRFSLGFFLISASYAVWAALNFRIASKLEEGIFALSLTNPPLMQVISVYSYIVLFIIGLLTIAYATLKTDRSEVFYLTVGLALTAVVASVSKFVTFRIVSLFIITFIAYYYFNEWYFNSNRRTCWTLMAFTLLVISNICFIFITTNTITYILGHLMELGAYSILLVNLLKTLKKR